jgi:hypothetical protein
LTVLRRFLLRAVICRFLRASFMTYASTIPFVDRGHGIAAAFLSRLQTRDDLGRLF